MTIEAQLADGRTLQFPDGTDPAVVQSTVKRVMGGQVQATPAAPQPEEPGALVRVGHGANNVVQGMKQLYYMASGQDDKLKDLTDQQNADEALYQKGRAANGQNGIDWLSLAGEAGMMAPAALVAAPVSIPARLAMGMGMGAAQGAATFDPSGSMGGKAMQAGVGALTGGAGQGAVELATPVVSKLAQKAVQGVTAAKNAVTGATARDAAQSAIAQAVGQDTWNALDAGTQDQLTTQAQSILARGRELDPDALLRKADIQAVGAQGTTGAITRDPTQWYWEQELAKMRGPQGDVGAPLVSRFQEDNAALMNQLPGMKRTGAASGYDAAEGAREAVQGFAKQSQSDVGQMYQSARDAADANTILPHDPVAQSLADITENYGIENVKPAIVNRAKEFGLLGGDSDGVRRRWLTIDEAERFRKLIGNNTDWKDPTSAAVGKSLQGSLDDAVSQVGTDAGTAFTQARQAASQRFQALEPRTVASLNNTDEAPVNFVESMITGKKPGEIAALRDVVTKQQPDAWNGIKATTLDWLQRKATSNDPEGKFSGKRFSDALDQIGMARLQEIFNPTEIAQLGTVKRASYALTREPPYAAVNHSNSGSTFANLVNNRLVGPIAAVAAHTIPIVGPMAVGAYAGGKEVLQSAAQAAAARAAANPGVAAYAPTAVDPAALRSAMAKLLLRAGLPVAIAGMDQTRSGP